MALIFGSQFIGHFIRDWQTNEQQGIGNGEQGTGIEIGIRISIRTRKRERKGGSWSRIKDVRHSLKNNGAEAAAKQKDPKQFSSSVCVCVCLHVGVAVCECACVGIFDVRPEVCYTKQQRQQ